MEKLPGCALSIIVDYDQIDDEHTYADIITGSSLLKTTMPTAMCCIRHRCLYQTQRIADCDWGEGSTITARNLCENLNLKGIVFGGRMPNYHKHAQRAFPKTIHRKSKAKEKSKILC